MPQTPSAGIFCLSSMNNAARAILFDKERFSLFRSVTISFHGIYFFKIFLREVLSFSSFLPGLPTFRKVLGVWTFSTPPPTSGTFSVHFPIFPAFRF
jgi:hypothetical protein